MEKDLKDKLFRIAFILVCIALVGLSFIILKNNNTCSKNPFVYGANEVYKQSKGNVEIFCSCSFSDPKYSSMYFNKEGINYGLKDPNKLVVPK